MNANLVLEKNTAFATASSPEARAESARWQIAQFNQTHKGSFRITPAAGGLLACEMSDPWGSWHGFGDEYESVADVEDALDAASDAASVYDPEACFERYSEADRRDIADAGRGHLLPPR